MRWSEPARGSRVTKLKNSLRSKYVSRGKDMENRIIADGDMSITNTRRKNKGP
jgi:hypothetical protein